ncbi:c-type cytochrome [Colwelliaceae bacterium BS250]
MAIAIVIVVLVIITVLFHFFSPWWFTPIASNWSSIDDTINITLWITGIVFILVNLFLAYAVYRFRYNKDRRADYEPENKKLETWLTVITSIGVIAMLAPGLVVWADFVHPPDNADEFEVVGQQWSWSYRFPGKDGILGQVDTLLISASNPFGLKTSDPNGQDDVLVNSNELHLTIDRPVKVLQRSKDVLHNFAIPQFRVKMDLVPGLTSYFWFTPIKLGQFDILCQELCGVAHYLMRGTVIIETEQEFALWLATFPTFSESQNIPTIDIAKGEQLYQGCVACHGQNAMGNEQLNAPKLAGLSSWYIQRQLHYFKSHIRGESSEDTFGQQMSAMMVTLPDKQAIVQVASYISSLENSQSKHVPSSIDSINIDNGRALYNNCSYCHGRNGEGNYSLNAPKLNGQHAWYLKRQLVNFQQGVRGSHNKDLYGKQMMLMAKLLQDQQAVDDIVAYIGAMPAQF